MIAHMQFVVQLAIGVVLLLASTGKWRNPLGFARGVAAYEVLPDRMSIAFGMFLIPLETSLAVSHLTGWNLQLAALIGLAMFTSFTFAVGLNLARGRNLPCYCFGDGAGESISTRALIRLVVLLGGESFLVFSPARPGTELLLYQQVGSLREFGFALFWTALLIIAVMWFLGLSDLFELLRSRSSSERQPQQAGVLA
ncbi:MAG: hypothetical protein C5B54_10360 [Acidobacteria bacterium]|nr:MAG: hypothetical protein C5B54_10360 [Acidobacteriota bacterium]